jgi:hypothetical protein
MRPFSPALARPPRLVLRFAVYTALTLALGGAGFLWYVHRYATAQAERAVRFHAGFVADTTLRSRLRRSDFEHVAEGVETGAVWDRLFGFGCDLAQGDYLSRPLPAGSLLLGRLAQSSAARSASASPSSVSAAASGGSKNSG